MKTRDASLSDQRFYSWSVRRRKKYVQAQSDPRCRDVTSLHAQTVVTLTFTSKVNTSVFNGKPHGTGQESQNSA